MHAVLRVADISKRFGGVRAANSVSFEVARGEIVGLIGPNGSGKSTIFNIITGGIRPDTGTVHVDGISVVGLPIYRIARLGLARTFQSIKIFRELTIRENMSLAAQGQSIEHWEDKADELISKFKLLHLMDAEGGTLSIGQQRLVEIAMQLLGQPKLLMFDEPLAGVHPAIRDVIADIIREERDRGTAVLLIEHDMSFVMSCCERIIALDYGSIIAQGSPDLIRTNDAVLASLLGSSPASASC